MRNNAVFNNVDNSYKYKLSVIKACHICIKYTNLVFNTNVILFRLKQ